MQDEKTALDLKTEIVCTYVEEAGIITEVERKLKAKGIKAGRQRINSIIRNSPEVVEWTKKFFDKAYAETCGNRLEAVSAISIQKSNELTMELMDKVRLLSFREMQKPTPDPKRLEYYGEFLKWNSISFINQNLVYSRFKDGLHAKQSPTVDQSQKTEQIYQFGEGMMGKELYGKLETYLAGKQSPRFAPLPPVESGGNGAVA